MRAPACPRTASPHLRPLRSPWAAPSKLPTWGRTATCLRRSSRRWGGRSEQAARARTLARSPFSRAPEAGDWGRCQSPGRYFRKDHGLRMFPPNSSAAFACRGPPTGGGRRLCAQYCPVQGKFASPTGNRLTLWESQVRGDRSAPLSSNGAPVVSSTIEAGGTRLAPEATCLSSGEGSGRQ